MIEDMESFAIYRIIEAIVFYIVDSKESEAVDFRIGPHQYTKPIISSAYAHLIARLSE